MNFLVVIKLTVMIFILVLALERLGAISLE